MILPNATLFPEAMLPLYIFEPRYRRMLTDTLQTHRVFSVAMLKPGSTRETPEKVAGVGLIRASVSNRDGTSNLILQGLARVELAETVQYKPYRVQRIHPLATPDADSVVIDALVAKVRELVEEIVERGPAVPAPLLDKLKTPEQLADFSKLAKESMRQFVEHLDKLQSPGQLADIVACTLLSSTAQRQVILEAVNLETRLKTLIQFLLAEVRRRKKNPSP